ncbi:MAG: hypothetical protein WCH46_07470 [bacterium]
MLTKSEIDKMSADESLERPVKLRERANNLASLRSLTDNQKNELDIRL